MPRAVRVAVLAALAVLICWRMPEIILKERFWAEEGLYFFPAAWTKSPLWVLTWNDGGYLNLVASVGALAARYLAPLRHAPDVTIGISLLVQLVTPALLLGAEDEWLRPPPVRLLACLLVILVPASEEVWLNTLHGQFHLTLASAVTAALRVPHGRAARTRRLLVLLLAALSGPGPFALLPVAALRACLERPAERAPRWAQVAALGVGVGLQLAFFFGIDPTRQLRLRPGLFLGLLSVRYVLVSFLGVEHATQIVHGSGQHGSGQHAPHLALWMELLPFCTIAPLILAGLRRSSTVVVWLGAAALALALLCELGAIGAAGVMLDPHWGERYAYAPQALFALAVLALAATAHGLTRWLAAGAAVWLLVTGARDYRRTWDFVGDGPSWRVESALWQRDHAHRIALWPKGWSVRLDRPGF